MLVDGYENPEVSISSKDEIPSLPLGLLKLPKQQERSVDQALGTNKIFDNKFRLKNISKRS